jgi:hypothetical protein
MCTDSEFDFFKDVEKVSDVTCMCQTDIGKDNDLIFGFENGDVFYCSEAKSGLGLNTLVYGSNA